jgi:hypothetical protein
MTSGGAVLLASRRLKQRAQSSWARAAKPTGVGGLDGSADKEPEIIGVERVARDEQL